MASFSSLARVLTFGLAGKAKPKSLTAPGPISVLTPDAAARVRAGTAPLPSTILGGPTPPDAAAAKTFAMSEAAKAALRQRKKAAGGGQSLVTGLGVNAPAVLQPKTLLGSGGY